jgi:hypothetical protein
MNQILEHYGFDWTWIWVLTAVLILRKLPLHTDLVIKFPYPVTKMQLSKTLSYHSLLPGRSGAEMVEAGVVSDVNEELGTSTIGLPRISHGESAGLSFFLKKINFKRG